MALVNEAHLQQVFDLDFRSSKAVRYHRKRYAFFEMWHSALTHLSVFATFSTFVVALAGKSSEWADFLIASSAVAFTATLVDLAFGLNHHMRFHDDMRASYQNVVNSIRMLQADRGFSPDDVIALSAVLHDLSTKERAIFHGVDALANEETCIALGLKLQDEALLLPRWSWKMAMRHFFQLSNTDFYRPRDSI